jgi:SAM-dependent methyltransferase
VNEASKAAARLKREGNFQRWITGEVLDIGAGNDPIMPDARVWDIPDGDAQKLESLEDASYDTVFSSHCLEHMRDPQEALANWWRVLKPGGHLVILVPDADLYEQGIWPSVFNPDHKWTFNISTDRTWSPRNKNLVELVKYLPGRSVLSVRLVGEGYDGAPGSVPIRDRTLGPAEAAIELVMQKVDHVLPLLSPLASLVPCPSCRQLQLTIVGLKKDKHLQVRCAECGTISSI